MRKWFIFILVFLLSIPFTLAQEEQKECGITNLSSCIAEKFFEYTAYIISAPLIPLLLLAKKLIAEPVNINLFQNIWAVIVYVLSMTYGLLLMYSGFNFIISGYDAEKRENAKAWLRNIIIMVVLVQASFYLYSLANEVSSLLTTGMLNLVDKEFFLLTVDNLSNFALQLFFGLFYVITLILTVLLLVIRYLIVAVGTILFPIGIYLYFIPSLRGYGKLILNFLLISIFITFFDALIFLASSKLLETAVFQNFKILIMIAAFSLANFAMFYTMLFSAVKSAINTTISVVSKYKMFGGFFRPNESAKSGQTLKDILNELKEIKKKMGAKK